MDAGTNRRAALAAAALAARGALGCPTWHRYQLALTGTAWAWAPAAALASATWAATRRSATSTLALAASVGACAALVPPRPPGPAGPPGGLLAPFTIAAANLYKHNRTPDDAVAALVALDADVVVAAEVTDRSAAALERLLGPPAATGHNGASPVHLHTRLTCRALAPLRVGNLAAPRVELADGPVVVGVHTVNPATGDHLGLWRSQLAALGSQPGPIVLAGDFNASVLHPEWRLVAGTDAATASGRALVRTWGPHPRAPRLLGLDHVVARGVPVSGFARHRIPGSDHDAVTASVC